MNRSPEITHGIIPEKWEAKLSVVQHADKFGTPPQPRVIAHFTTELRSGEHGFVIDTERRVIGHESMSRYVGAVVEADSIVDFAEVMGLPQPLPPVHEIAQNMPHIEQVFLTRVQGGEHEFYANQNVWTDVKSILEQSKMKTLTTAAD